MWLFEPKKHLEIKDARRAPRPIYKSAGIGNAALAVWGACIYGPPRRTLYETNAFPIILDSRCRNNGKSHTLGTFPYVRARLQAPRWGCDGGPVRIVGPPRAVPPKGTLTLPFRQLIFGARLAGTEVKRGWRFSPCSKYYPGGVEICGAEKILPDLYFCDGQAIMSMKLTEGST